MMIRNSGLFFGLPCISYPITFSQDTLLHENAWDPSSSDGEGSQKRPSVSQASRIGGMEQ